MHLVHEGRNTCVCSAPAHVTSHQELDRTGVAESEQRSTNPCPGEETVPVRTSPQSLVELASELSSELSSELASEQGWCRSWYQGCCGHKPLSWTARRASKSADSLLRGPSSLRSICCVEALNFFFGKRRQLSIADCLDATACSAAALASGTLSDKSGTAKPRPSFSSRPCCEYS